jgi:hypothetical protein
MTRLFVLFVAIALAVSAGASTRTAPSFGPSQLQPLLQAFVNAEYGKAFRHLGDERDFDHGHVLMSPDGSRAEAILYHTQELAHRESAGSDFGYLPGHERNWLQWADGRVENARAYARHDYPRTATWDWFKARELPALTARGTVTDVMLDPQRLGFAPSTSRQWTFSKVACAPAAAPAPRIAVKLPTGEPVCLALEVL